ncbi:TIGR01777 family oxidoreductase [Bacteroidota bacterium]
MKKICIIGGTGFIGKHLIRLLTEKDYLTISFSRAVDKSKRLLPMTNKHIKFDLESDNWKSEIEGCYAIINLAGASIAGGRWTKKYKKKIYDSRIQTTKALADVINNLVNPPKVFINASAVGYYNDEGDEIITEKSVNGSGFLAKVCADWEQEALRVRENTRVVLVRTGIVLDKYEGALSKMLFPFKFLIGGALGSGKQWMPWIHIDDVAALYLRSIENGNIEGAVNFTAPNPVRMSEFSKILGRVMGKPSIFRIPSFVLKFIMGESSEIVLIGQRAIPQKALENGYKFKFNNLNDALTDLW